MSDDSLMELASTVEVEELGSGQPGATVELADDVAAVSREFAARGWSDGLPVIPPTESRVAAMLAGTSSDPLEVIGILPPRRGEATVHAIAVNAVMAGCVPEHMPVLIAAVGAIAHPEFNLSGVNATTHPVSLFLLVSGPIAADLGIHAGSGCFGPGFPANATLGRALRLIQLTVSGAWPGSGDRSTQATPAKLAFCATENLEVSPWPPFHHHPAASPPTRTPSPSSAARVRTISRTTAATRHSASCSPSPARCHRPAATTSSRAARPCSPSDPSTPPPSPPRAGPARTSKTTSSRMPVTPLTELSDELFQVIQEHTEQGVPVPLFERDAMAPIADKPESIHVIVAGGPGKHSAWLPTFGNMTRPVTMPVD